MFATRIQAHRYHLMMFHNNVEFCVLWKSKLDFWIQILFYWVYVSLFIVLNFSMTSKHFYPAHSKWFFFLFEFWVENRIVIENAFVCQKRATTQCKCLCSFMLFVEREFQPIHVIMGNENKRQWQIHQIHKKWWVCMCAWWLDAICLKSIGSKSKHCWQHCLAVQLLNANSTGILRGQLLIKLN